MSKVTKLVNNPKLFLKDAVLKKLGAKPAPAKPAPAKPAPAKPAPAKPAPAKPAPAKPAPAKKAIPAKKPAPTMIIDSLNPFKNINHIIHTGEGMTHGPSHLSLWIPEFIKADVEFAVLTRHLDIYKWTKEKYPWISVVYAKGPTDVERVFNNMAFLRAVYYLSNTGNLIHTLRYNIYEHIFLGHGDSDKSASAHKFFRVYDQIWVAGQAHIDRFKNAGFNVDHISFVKVGRPSIANILQQNNSAWHERMEPRILYLPTWEGAFEESNYSSVRLSVAMLTEVAQRFSLHIAAKFHPSTGKRDPTLLQAPKYLGEELSKLLDVSYTIHDKADLIPDLLLTSNIFICDVSAVVSECISANGPIFVYIPKDKDIIVSNSDMAYADYAYTFSSIDELCEKIEDVLNGNDYLAEKRKLAMDYILSINDTMKNEFSRRLQELSLNDTLQENIREKIIQ